MTTFEVFTSRVGEGNGQVFIVMELVEGRLLNSLIPSAGLSAALVVRYGAQIAAALGHAQVNDVLIRRSCRCADG